MADFPKLPTKKNRFFYITAAILLWALIIYLFFLIKPSLKPLSEFLQTVFIPVLLGLLIAYLLNPVVKRLEKFKMPRIAALLLIYFSFFLIISIAVLKAIPILSKQLIELSDDLPTLRNRYETWIQEWDNHKYFLPDTVQIGVDRAIIYSQDKMSSGITNLVDVARNALGKLVGFAVIPFIAFYFLKDMKEIQRGILLWIPRKYRRHTQLILRDVHESLGKYIHGQIVISLLVGVCSYIGLWLIGMPYPFVLASFVAVTNIIPYIGPLIGAIPAVLIALTISLQKVIFVLVLIIFLQIIEGNIIAPNIMGKSLHLHPLLIIILLLAGEAIGGIWGMILVVPLFAVAKVILNRIILFRQGS
ncbi:AI-2E family transporter [Brevibacillus daliensis]|uniref:AI-2E family transporter n=1 Tax=Brevibacillus daliensis TaxID=2892995 RepID=UPI001E41E2B0|nr:AI-2E family transporter [Brevibacillus daliensis]